MNKVTKRYKGWKRKQKPIWIRNSTLFDRNIKPNKAREQKGAKARERERGTKRKKNANHKGNIQTRLANDKQTERRNTKEATTPTTSTDKHANRSMHRHGKQMWMCIWLPIIVVTLDYQKHSNNYWRKRLRKRHSGWWIDGPMDAWIDGWLNKCNTGKWQYENRLIDPWYSLTRQNNHTNIVDWRVVHGGHRISYLFPRHPSQFLALRAIDLRRSRVLENWTFDNPFLESCVALKYGWENWFSFQPIKDSGTWVVTS